MKESVDLHEEADLQKTSKRWQIWVLIAEEAMSNKDEVEIEKFLQEQK